MFPLGFVFLTTAALAGGLSNSSLRNQAIATFIFLAVGEPFIAVLSYEENLFTFSDVGPEAYEVFVDGVDPFIPANPGATHPVQQIVNAPKTFEFRMPSRNHDAVPRPACDRAQLAIVLEECGAKLGANGARNFRADALFTRLHRVSLCGGILLGAVAGRVFWSAV